MCVSLFECQNCPLSLQLKYNSLYFFLFSNEPVTWNFQLLCTVYCFLYGPLMWDFFENFWWHFLNDAKFVKVLLMNNPHNRKHYQKLPISMKQRTNGRVSCYSTEIMTWTLRSPSLQYQALISLCLLKY